jgi:hypothetical protein
LLRLDYDGVSSECGRCNSDRENQPSALNPNTKVEHHGKGGKGFELPAGTNQAVACLRNVFSSIRVICVICVSPFGRNAA